MWILNSIYTDQEMAYTLVCLDQRGTMPSERQLTQWPHGVSGVQQNLSEDYNGNVLSFQSVSHTLP